MKHHSRMMMLGNNSGKAAGKVYAAIPLAEYPLSANLNDSLGKQVALAMVGSLTYGTRGGYGCIEGFGSGKYLRKTELWPGVFQNNQKFAMSVDIWMDTNNQPSGYLNCFYNSKAPTEVYGAGSFTSSNDTNPKRAEWAYQINSVGAAIASANNLVETGRWYNYTALGGTTGIKLFLDRVLVASNLAKTNYYTQATANDLDFGAHSFFSSAHYLRGAMKRLRFFSNAGDIEDIAP